MINVTYIVNSPYISFKFARTDGVLPLLWYKSKIVFLTCVEIRHGIQQYLLRQRHEMKVIENASRNRIAAGQTPYI